MIETGKQKIVNKFFETGAQAPYLLRRETHFTDAANPTADHEETSEVIAVDKPYRVQSEIRPVSFERVVQKDSLGTTITVDVTSVDVPGGIVNRTSKHLDADGHVDRERPSNWSTTAPSKSRPRMRAAALPPPPAARRFILDHVDVSSGPIATPPAP